MTRNLIITPVLNGFVVQAGCQQLVFKSASELATNIQRYYENPQVVEAEFIKSAVNKTMDNAAPCDRSLSYNPRSLSVASQERCEAQAVQPRSLADMR